MTEDEQKNLVILGKLQAIHTLMNTELPEDKDVKDKFFKAKRLLFQALDMHWDKCNSMLNKNNIKEPDSAT